MGWGFRKRIKIAPGINLNISKRGVSTTIGRKGASVNIGKDGTYLNTGIPGTGFYSRQKIGGQKKKTDINTEMSGNQNSKSSKGCTPVGCGIIVLIGIIANIEASKRLPIIVLLIGIVVAIFLYFFIKEFRGNTSKRKEIEEMISEEDDEKRKIFLRGLLTQYNKEESNKEIYIDSELNDIQRESFKKMCSAYEKLCTCDKIWLVISETANTEMKSLASHSISRRKVKFEKQFFNNVLSKDTQFVPTLSDCITNYFIYPQYVVKAKGETIFEVFPITDIRIKYESHSFIEDSDDSQLPHDSRILRYTYRKVNKDGTPDLRFKGNKKLPIYQYGGIIIDKFGVEFMVSNAEKARAFVDAFIDHKEVMAKKYVTKTVGKKEVTSTTSSKLTRDILKMLDNTTKINGDDPKDTELVTPKPNNVFGVTKEYYDGITKTTNSLVEFYQLLLKDNTIMDKVEHCVPVGDSPENKLMTLFFSDMMKLYKAFGYNYTDVVNKEGLPLVLLCMNVIRGEKLIPISFETLNLLQGLGNSVPKSFEGLKNAFDNYPDEDFFFIPYILRRCNREDLIIRYFTSLYRLFSIISKVDNVITDNEQKWLDNLMKFTVQSQKENREELEIKNNTTGAGVSDATTPKETERNNPIDQLNELSGLDSVKTEVNNLANLVKVQKMREGRGMKTTPISYHCVFTGNPGTGKTTVARIIAEIYKDLGVIKKGHLVETDRSGLVAEYVGQTAVKTNKIIDSALDGVLFIDEAYSLIQGSQNDFGKEAISTLLKRMEDDRDRLVVILAGYSKEMEDFINSNSGLQSRFNRYIEFPDYSCSELTQIFNFIIKKNEFVLTDEASKQVENVIAKAVEHKDQNFGNARYIRNLFEKVLTQQANRISSVQDISNEVLSTIEEVDIINAAQ